MSDSPVTVLAHPPTYTCVAEGECVCGGDIEFETSALQEVGSPDWRAFDGDAGTCLSCGVASELAVGDAESYSWLQE